MCERRHRHPGPPVPNNPYGLSGRKATLKKKHQIHGIMRDFFHYFLPHTYCIQIMIRFMFPSPVYYQPKSLFTLILHTVLLHTYQAHVGFLSCSPVCTSTTALLKLLTISLKILRHSSLIYVWKKRRALFWKVALLCDVICKNTRQLTNWWVSWALCPWHLWVML